MGSLCRGCGDVVEEDDGRGCGRCAKPEAGTSVERGGAATTTSPGSTPGRAPDEAELGQLATAEARDRAKEALRLERLAEEALARGDVAGAKWLRKRAENQVQRAGVAELKARIEARVNDERRRS